jgi:hypothetical protein
MPRYYFDLRDDDACTFDDVGLVLAGVEAAREESTRALADLSQGVLVGAHRKVLAIEVRDEAKQALFELRLVLHATSRR